jgi:hypothetical protein
MSFEFLCVWTLAYLLNALVNNKTSSLLKISNDGTTNIRIANIDIAIANIKISQHNVSVGT